MVVLYIFTCETNIYDVNTTMVPTVWTITMGKIFFNQNKKLIAISDRETSVRRGAKMSDSVINGGKSSLLEHRRLDFPIDPKDYIYDEKEKNNRIKIWEF